MTYAEHGEDDILAALFGDYVGYAVDVGAGDGRTINNTLLFEERGWDVLCVEANPLHHPALLAARRRVATVAASDRDGRLLLHRYDRCGSPLATVGPLHPAMRARYAPQAVETDAIEVPCLTLDTLLGIAGFPQVDLLSIDVDGHELAVLNGFDIARWAPRAVLIEDTGIDPGLVAYLDAFDYVPDSRIVKLGGFNDLWIAKGKSHA